MRLAISKITVQFEHSVLQEVPNCQPNEYIFSEFWLLWGICLLYTLLVHWRRYAWPNWKSRWGNCPFEEMMKMSFHWIERSLYFYQNFTPVYSTFTLRTGSLVSDEQICHISWQSLTNDGTCVRHSSYSPILQNPKRDVATLNIFILYLCRRVYIYI